MALPLGTSTLFYAAKFGALALMDTGVMRAAAWLDPPKLRFRMNNPKAKGQEKHEGIDALFLGINTVVEYIFMAHMAHLVLESEMRGAFPIALSDLSLFNTVPALWLLFCANDCFYAPSHGLLHTPFLYPFIHKHHHRQALPFRGYLDAGNEHPLEQVIGLGALWCALQVVGRLTRAHAFTILVYFVAHAALAVCRANTRCGRFQAPAELTLPRLLCWPHDAMAGSEPYGVRCAVRVPWVQVRERSTRDAPPVPAHEPGSVLYVLGCGHGDLPPLRRRALLANRQACVASPSGAWAARMRVSRCFTSLLAAFTAQDTEARFIIGGAGARREFRRSARK
jgi:hypothetical protein